MSRSQCEMKKLQQPQAFVFAYDLFGGAGDPRGHSSMLWCMSALTPPPSLVRSAIVTALIRVGAARDNF